MSGISVMRLLCIGLMTSHGSGGKQSLSNESSPISMNKLSRTAFTHWRRHGNRGRCLTRYLDREVSFEQHSFVGQQILVDIDLPL
jgi:hypothetical protein